MYLGAFKPRVRPVYMRREKPGCELITDTEKLRYLLLPPANFQTLKIRELEPDFYFSHEEIKYISLDALIDKIRVFAACTNQFSTKEPTKKLVKQILHRHIEKKKTCHS